MTYLLHFAWFISDFLRIYLLYFCAFLKGPGIAVRTKIKRVLVFRVLIFRVLLFRALAFRALASYALIICFPVGRPPGYPRGIVFRDKSPWVKGIKLMTNSPSLGKSMNTYNIICNSWRLRVWKRQTEIHISSAREQKGLGTIGERHNGCHAVYLTIRPFALKSYRSIAHEAQAFSVRLVVPTSRMEKAVIKLANASWRNIYMGIKRKKAARISLLDDYY